MSYSNSPVDLAKLFQGVTDALIQSRPTLNLADSYNGNHGDHIVEVFQVATQAAKSKPEMDLAGAMESASRDLYERSENGTAQVYARGLAELAVQFRKYHVSLDDLLFYVGGLLQEKKETSMASSRSNASDVLKALLAGLAGWQQDEAGQPRSVRPVDMGYLFELGMAYMQAKQRGGSKLEVLADAAAAASPLSKVPHREQSGKIALQALLDQMAESTE